MEPNVPMSADRIINVLKGCWLWGVSLPHVVLAEQASHIALDQEGLTYVLVIKALSIRAAYTQGVDPDEPVGYARVEVIPAPGLEPVRLWRGTGPHELHLPDGVPDIVATQIRELITQLEAECNATAARMDELWLSPAALQAEQERIRRFRVTEAVKGLSNYNGGRERN